MHGSIALKQTLNRKGRKRKSGRRTSTGRLAQKPVDYRGLAENWPHRKSLPVTLRSHERGESQLGRLSLLKRISESQFEAGRRFSVVVGSFLAVSGAPKGTAGGSGKGDCWGDDTGCLMPSCECERKETRYRAATCWLLDAGQRAYNVTYQVVISDMECADDQLVHLRNGLDALAGKMGIGR